MAADNKWQTMQNERNIGFPPIMDPTQFAGPVCSAVRIRKEPNARDYMNSRMWDSFRATPPTQVSADVLQAKEGPRYMDMNPQASRKNTQQFRFQLDYMPTTELPAKENSTNPYMQRLDAAGSDSRNVVRELRGAVVEDNRERDVEANKRLTERQFVDRFMPPRMAADAASLDAYELLRPKQHDN
jgi:hypothetical protein